MQTYNQIIKLNQTFAENHFKIQTFGNGPEFDIALHDKQAWFSYPLMWMEDLPLGLNENEVTFSFRVYFLDQVSTLEDREDDKIETNNNEVKSDQISNALDLLSFWAQDSTYPELDLVKSGSVQTLDGRFPDRLTGCYVDLKLKQGFRYNKCNIPMTGVIPVDDSCLDATFQNSDNTFSQDILSGATFISSDVIHSINGFVQQPIPSNVPFNFIIVPAVNTVLPVISGGLYIGDTLTTTDGTWTGTDLIFTYQWQSEGVDITGATSDSHTLVDNDGGLDITCDVTATNVLGAVPATSNTITGEDRYFATRNGVDMYNTIPTVTLTGDFELEFQFVINPSGTVSVIGNNSNNDNFIILFNTGAVILNIDGSFVSFSAGMINLSDNLSIFKLRKVGNDFTISQENIDLQTVISVSAGAKTLSLNVIGQKNNQNYFDNVISTVKITDGTDLIRNYPLNETLGTTTIVDYGSDGSNGTAVNMTALDTELMTLDGADWLGIEVIDNGDFATDLSDWTIHADDATHKVTWVSGEARFESDTTSPIMEFRSVNTPVVGNRYKGMIKATYTSGTIFFGDFGSANSLSEGANEFVYNPSSARFAFFRQTSNLDVLLDDVSVKRILQAP